MDQPLNPLQTRRSEILRTILNCHGTSASSVDRAVVLFYDSIRHAGWAFISALWPQEPCESVRFYYKKDAGYLSIPVKTLHTQNGPESFDHVRGSVP